MSTPLLKLLFAAAAALFLFSCKKNPPAQQQPEAQAFKIVKKISASPSDQVRYEYNAKGHLSRYISQWQDAAGTLSTQTNVFEHNASGHLVKWSNEGGYGLYTSNNGLPERSEHFGANGRKIATLTYTFNASKRLLSVLEDIASPAPGDPTQTRISYLYHSDGNLSRMEFAYRNGPADAFVVSFSKKFVQYDGKKNPEPDGVLGAFLPGIILLFNNPVRVENINADGSVEGYTRYEYTYNAEGYPVQKKQFIGVNNVEHAPAVFTYEY